MPGSAETPAVHVSVPGYLPERPMTFELRWDYGINHEGTIINIHHMRAGDRGARVRCGAILSVSEQQLYRWASERSTFAAGILAGLERAAIPEDATLTFLEGYGEGLRDSCLVRQTRADIAALNLNVTK